ncbi:MAG: transposase [Acidobacteria bacterium]|nr:transposase [Acidobacteriota bacterium]
MSIRKYKPEQIVTALRQMAGWEVGKDRVQRIWRREGLKVPQKQRPRGRLWLQDGSCVRLRPEHPNHVWSYDFVSARTHDGRTLRLLTLIDEHTRECLEIRVERRMGSQEVIEAWRREYNESRPHRALGERTPHEFAHQIAASRDLMGLLTAQHSLSE